MDRNKRKTKDLSPESVNISKNPKAEKSLKMDAQQMQVMLDQFRDSMTLEIRQSEERLGSKFDSTVTALAGRVETLEAANIALKEENRILTEKIARVEENSRRNNVIISGIKATNHGEALNCVREIIHKTMKRPIDVGNVRLIKQKMGAPKIVVSCKFFEDKMEMLAHKKDFRSREGNEIFINDDLTKEQSQLQFELRGHAKRLRDSGKTVKIRRGQFQVNDGPWTTFDPQGCTPELDV